MGKSTNNKILRQTILCVKMILKGGEKKLFCVKFNFVDNVMPKALK